MTGLALDALAAYRVTRLVTADTITQPWRDRLILWSLRHRDLAAIKHETGWVADGFKHEGDVQILVEVMSDPPKLAALITCRWCSGFWCACAVVAARRLMPRVWAPCAEALAISAAAALIARLETD